LNSSYAHVERHRHREGELFLEMHADDLLQRDLRHGQLVNVSNQLGSVVARCRKSDRVRPGVVWMPFGGFGDARNNACSVNAVTPEEPTDWGGGSGFYDAFVDVVAVGATDGGQSG